MNWNELKWIDMEVHTAIWGGSKIEKKSKIQINSGKKLT